jgi:hypothetical protein
MTRRLLIFFVALWAGYASYVVMSQILAGFRARDWRDGHTVGVSEQFAKDYPQMYFKPEPLPKSRRGK